MFSNHSDIEYHINLIRENMATKENLFTSQTFTKFIIGSLVVVRVTIRVGQPF